MKRGIWRVCVCVIFLLALPGCKEAETKKLQNTSTMTEMLSFWEDCGMVRAVLVVNGETIYNPYTYIPDLTLADSYQAHFSLTAVLEALGAEIQYSDAEVLIKYNGDNRVINTDEYDWGILVLPGGGCSIREIVNNELIIDHISVEGLLRNFMYAEINVDYDTRTVYVDQTDTR